MQFYNSTKTYIEKDCVLNHKDELRQFGSRAMIVTGHSSAKNGALDDVTNALDAIGIPHVIFNDVEENPSVETVEKAARIGKQLQADFVIGIGGGSPLDAAKSVSVLLANPEQTGQCFLQKQDHISFLPVVEVPTTCGTGSEVTPNAVLTYHQKKTKGSMPYRDYPKMALVDGKYLLGAPYALIINTSVDALAHCVESFLHTKANTLTRMFSGYGLQLWGHLKQPLLDKQPLDEQLAQDLMMQSTVAGMAISQAGTSLPHVMSYQITYFKNVPHGKACGIYLGSYVRQYEKNDPATVKKMLDLLGFENVDSFCQCLNDLIGTITLTQEEVDNFSKEIFANTGKLATYPFPITKEDIDTIFRESLHIE